MKILWQNCRKLPSRAGLKVLFWEILRELQLSDTVPPWYSSVVPIPNCESPKAQAYWDIPAFAVSEQVRQKRVDARFRDHEKKRVLTVEMTCPWTEKEKRNKRRPPSTAPSAGNSSSSSQDMTFGSMTSS